MTGSAREEFRCAMETHGADGMLLMRTSGGSPAALNPLPRLTGEMEVTVECTTLVDGKSKKCGRKSGPWMTVLPARAWARAHAEVTGHGDFAECAWSRLVVFLAVEGAV
ncbi:hypothetical protein ACH4OW_02765 [Streptomyces sp. NPDC017056]|uniref:DUF7848 domain-containing protein n=1 Tax=Streptomyces sp. NPDC017056 TaxID=3364973 RepID=UPI00378A9AA9